MMQKVRAAEGQTPFNDAHLVQLVRGALGRTEWNKGSSRINVSSCEYVVTLHGIVPDSETRDGIETVVREVPGVQRTVNKLRVLEEVQVAGVSPGRV